MALSVWGFIINMKTMINLYNNICQFGNPPRSTVSNETDNNLLNFMCNHQIKLLWYISGDTMVQLSIYLYTLVDKLSTR